MRTRRIELFDHIIVGSHRELLPEGTRNLLVGFNDDLAFITQVIEPIGSPVKPMALMMTEELRRVLIRWKGEDEVAWMYYAELVALADEYNLPYLLIPIDFE